MTAVEKVIALSQTVSQADFTDIVTLFQDDSERIFIKRDRGWVLSTKW